MDLKDRDLKDQGRREPTLADLEAFERLLRDSLQSQPVAAAPAMPAPAASAPVDAARSAALAELTRLVDEPLPFGAEAGAIGPQADDAGAGPAIVAPQTFAPQTSAPQTFAPQTATQWAHLEAIPPANAYAGHAWQPDAAIPAAAPSPDAPAVGAAVAPAQDPLLAFEEELRKFDQRGYPASTMPDDPYGALRPDYAGSADPSQVGVHGYQPGQDHWAGGGVPLDQQSPPDALAAAEQKLAAEAAIAAAAAGVAAANAQRSRKIFFGLGGVAVAGLAAIGLTFALGGKPAEKSGGIPVVAARPEPAKERPANPGGVDIPDQNRQVLAPKQAAEPTRPAQAVNNTEQPMDLNQVTRRDSVRVIAPSPFQPNQQGQAPADNAPAPAAGEASGEPRRVQSVRLGDPAPPAPVPQAATPSVSPGAVAAGAAGAAAIGAIAAGAARGNAAQTPAAPAQSPVAPPRLSAVQAPTLVAPAAPAPPKVETRPQSVTPAPRPAQPQATAPAPRPQNAPLPLTNSRPQQQASAPTATSGGGGYAVQLASRPTAEDARSAASQLGSRFASALGGRQPGVVSGEANGRTVYRVRASGYSQADATAACNRVKAAGGQCFVTR